MNERELKKFEKQLLEERERLFRNIRNIEEVSRSGYGRDNGLDLTSFAETGTDSFDLETSLNIAGYESEQLMEIDDALDRIKRGTYGICEGSGKPIPKKRLEAFPAARFCIEHQERLEKENAMRR